MKSTLEKFKKYLGPYSPMIIENDEAVAWGHIVIARINSPALWDELKTLGHLVVVENSVVANTWAIITRYMTYPEAVALFGPHTEEERGPRGGFRSITFGDKRFYSKTLKSA